MLAAALLFSTGGTVIKAVALTSWQVVAGRSLFAAIVIMLSGSGVWRGLSWRPVLVGAAQAATLVTFVTANKLTTAANAVFLQATAPLYIALLGPFLLGEHMKRRDIPLLVLIFGGVLLLFAGSHAPLATAPHRVLGTLIGIVSGFCWSLTVMGLRWIARADPEHGSHNARAAAVVGNVLAFLVCVPAAFPMPAPGVADLLGVALPRRVPGGSVVPAAVARAAPRAGRRRVTAAARRAGVQPALGVAGAPRGPRLLAAGRRRVDHRGRDDRHLARLACAGAAESVGTSQRLSADSSASAPTTIPRCRRP